MGERQKEREIKKEGEKVIESGIVEGRRGTER